MKTLLKIILALRGCRHRWETIRVVPVYGPSSNKPYHFDYELRCQKCGDVKRRRV